MIITIYTFAKTNLNIKFEMDIMMRFRFPTDVGICHKYVGIYYLYIFKINH